MIDQLFSWGTLLSIIGVIGFHLAGKKIWWAWYVNLANQVLWFTYAIVTGQYGFLIGAIFYTIVFIKNAYVWTRDHYDIANEPIVAHNIAFDREMMSNQILMDASFEQGVRQAMTWLRADYTDTDMPDWRYNGVGWISDRLMEWKETHPDG